MKRQPVIAVDIEAFEALVRGGGGSWDARLGVLVEAVRRNPPWLRAVYLNARPRGYGDEIAIPAEDNHLATRVLKGYGFLLHLRGMGTLAYVYLGQPDIDNLKDLASGRTGTVTPGPGRLEAGGDHRRG